MKTTAIILSISAVVMLIVACVPKTKVPNTTTVIVAARDITDTALSKPIAEEITPLYDFEKSQWNGGKFRFVDISDVSYNRTQEASIEQATEWLSNEFERKKQVKVFNERIAQILADADSEKVGKDFSSVYVPLARELNLLSQNIAQRRIMLVYSDLMENTTNLSFYDTATFRLLTANPDVIRNIFEKELHLEDLKGIEIKILYKPADPNKDRQFKVVSEFFRQLFESKGAKVYVGVNI